MSAFEELGVMPEIITSLDEMDWSLPTPVQTEAIPLILGGGDVAVAAETGSGKTGAFCLPTLQIVYESRRTNIDNIEEVEQKEDGGGDTEITLSSTDRGRSVAVDTTTNIAQLRHPVVWDGARATKGVTNGKWYFIARLTDDGIGRVGWSSKYASLLLGTDSKGFGFGATAMKSHHGKFQSYGLTFKKNDHICCMIDIDMANAKLTISYMKNNMDLGNAFELSISNLNLLNFPLYPTISMKNAEMQMDFQMTNEQVELLGYKNMRQATLEDSKISDDLKNLLTKNNNSNKKMKDHKQSEEDTQSDDSNEKEPLILILEPSRELANQVHEEMTKFRKYLPADTTRLLLLIGGGNDFKQDKNILKSGCDIVAGTLGSILAQVKKGSLSLNSIRFFILDEADTFATDNLKDVEFLHKKIPTKNRVQTLLFSATLHSPEIRNLSEKIQSFPTWVDLKGKESVPESVHHTMIRIDANADTSLLNEDVYKHITWPLDKVHDKDINSKGGNDSKNDIEMEDAADQRSYFIKKLKLVTLQKVIDANQMSQAMIFVRSQLDGDNVESFLLQCSGVSPSNISKKRFRSRGYYAPEIQYSCAVLHGGRRQQERNEALGAFKAGEVRFLICTDVAARGIDVIGLPFLINLTLPDKSENYIHRVGRVGRAERLGLAVSLIAAQKEAVWYHSCGKAKNGVCKQRNLVDEGGCVLWYNEPKLLNEIEDRLKGRVEELSSNYKRKDECAKPILYGSRAGEEKIFEETKQHVESLQPAVQKLMKMEEEAQASFFALQTEYSLST